MNRKSKAWFASLLLMAVAISAAVPILDEGAEDRYQGMFQRALVTFALARTLNGVISTVQGTELALQPAGVGLTLTPGQILDPVNDLVERFSWVMLASSVSLGVQNVLLEFSRWWPVRILVATLCLLALAAVWRAEGGHVPRWLGGLLAVLLIVRFSVPVTFIVSDALYRVFLDDRYQQSTQVISAAGSELERLGAVEANAPVDTEESQAGLFGSFTRVLDGAAEALDVRAKVQQISEKTANLIEHLIQLAVIFLLQTVILPIGFLWFLFFWIRKIPKYFL